MLEARRLCVATLASLATAIAAAQSAVAVVAAAQPRAVAEYTKALALMAELAALMRDCGERHEARHLLEELLERRVAFLGPSHPDTMHAEASFDELLAEDACFACLAVPTGVHARGE